MYQLTFPRSFIEIGVVFIILSQQMYHTRLTSPRVLICRVSNAVPDFLLHYWTEHRILWSLNFHLLLLHKIEILIHFSYFPINIFSYVINIKFVRACDLYIITSPHMLRTHFALLFHWPIFAPMYWWIIFYFLDFYTYRHIVLFITQLPTSFLKLLEDLKVRNARERSSWFNA